jgi:hypothetical protein
METNTIHNRATVDFGHANVDVKEIWKIMRLAALLTFIGLD